MVDGSNESLYHADEEMHPLVRTFSPSQTIFQNLDVPTHVTESKFNHQKSYWWKMRVCVCVFKFLLKQSIMLLSPPLKPKEIQLREKRCYEPGKHPP